MKNFTNIKWIVLFSFVLANAQQEKGIVGSNNWLSNWTEFKPQKKDYNSTNQILFSTISSNMTLTKRNTYLLQGNVYVTNNATLTIEPGTVIRGDSETNGTLIITKGSKIIANGLETDPIVFTSNNLSRKAGDWGGIIIIGDAPINKFGGSAALSFDIDQELCIYGGINPMSDSGSLKFVRIEFAGRKVKGFKEFNALSLAGVGNKTVIENVMASFSADDSYEIYGGDIKMTKVVSYKAVDDDFDFTQGAQVVLDNSLAIRSPLVSGATVSRCMEIDSYDKKEETDFSKKQTAIIANNVSLINISENLDADISSGLVKESVWLGENASLSLKKSMISGFNPAVVLDSKTMINEKTFAKVKFELTYFNNCKGNIFTQNNTNNEDLENWYGNSAFNNYYASGTNDVDTFIDINNLRDPDFRIRIQAITASK